jgi:hypothetical protein
MYRRIVLDGTMEPGSVREAFSCFAACIAKGQSVNLVFGSYDFRFCAERNGVAGIQIRHLGRVLLAPTCGVEDYSLDTPRERVINTTFHPIEFEAGARAWQTIAITPGQSAILEVVIHDRSLCVEVVSPRGHEFVPAGVLRIDVRSDPEGGEHCDVSIIPQQLLLY